MRAMNVAPARPVVWAYIAPIAFCGAAVIAFALHAATATPIEWYVIALAALTLVTGQFPIHVPGQPATVSVSDVFVFTLVMIGQAPAAILTVALDGATAMIRHRERRWYRLVFNVTEPAVSVAVAIVAYTALRPDAPLSFQYLHLYTPAVVALALTYFLTNSWLMAGAVAVERGGKIVDLWRRHAPYVAINYFSAAVIALAAAAYGQRFDIAVLVTVTPVVVLSYAAYLMAARRVEEADRHTEDVNRLHSAIVEAFASAVDAKDQVTHGHVRRVQRHACALARALGATEHRTLKALDAASLLHDIGKLAISDHILNKPGKLSQAEYAAMKQHATIGATILEGVDFPYPVVPIVRHHHENWDGTGYPDGLAGDAIPLGARILAVVDCFDAVTSDRPYRRRMTDEQGIALLRARRGTMYDPDVVDRFISLIADLRSDDPHVDMLAAEGRTQPILSVVAEPISDHDFGALIAGVRDNAQGLAMCVREVLPRAEVSVFVRDAGQRLVAAFQTVRLATGGSTRHVDLGQGLTGWVAATRCSITNSDPSLDLGDNAASLNLKACTAVPILAAGDLVGVLTVYGQTPCTPAEARRLGHIAQLAAYVGVADDEMPGRESMVGAPAHA